MSQYDYGVSKKLVDVPFYALIMAAMRDADTYNLEALQNAFPDTYQEMMARYHAPGGVLELDA